VSDRISGLQELFGPVVEALGCQLWGVEFNGQGKYSVLRVYIDKEGGIGVQDCAEVSRQVSSILDVEDPISSEYTLEVSSPGLERPLFTIEQYETYTGHELKVQLRVKFENRRNFSGVLKGVEDNEILLVADDVQYTLPFELIEKANLVSRF
jgi:ribosome maturation factor RimP